MWVPLSDAGNSVVLAGGWFDVGAGLGGVKICGLRWDVIQSVMWLRGIKMYSVRNTD